MKIEMLGNLIRIITDSETLYVREPLVNADIQTTFRIICNILIYGQINHTQICGNQEYVHTFNNPGEAEWIEMDEDNHQILTIKDCTDDEFDRYSLLLLLVEI